jgi:hypothetical protein
LIQLETRRATRGSGALIKGLKKKRKEEKKKGGGDT